MRAWAARWLIRRAHWIAWPRCNRSVAWPARKKIGRVCLFLASEDASFITGQGIEADGGAALDY